MTRFLTPVAPLTTLTKVAFTLFCYSVLMVFAAPAQTLQQIKDDPGNNNPPPPGWILNLNGQTIPTAYQQYTVQFQAALANTAITFAFRNDPSFTSFTNASVTDVTNPNSPGPNLLLNGDFSLGTVGSTPVDWTYANIYGATFGGVVQSGCGMPVGNGNGNCWYDGAVQAYDAISQTIATTVGVTYQISFYLTAGGGSTFSEVSTNGDTTDTGGNGINVTVYAQAGLPPPPPPGETLTLTELGKGSGNVMDNMEEINCSLAEGSQSGTCSANYPSGTVVTLTENATSPSTFGGWGGACASFGTNASCSVTMDSAQHVTAIFNVAGPTQDGEVQTGTETVLNFQGGVPNGGYNYNAELTSGSPVAAQVTAIPIQDQTTCNTIVQPSFPGAQCFVYQNGNGPSAKAPVMFELTCPDSPGGTCGSMNQPNFFATLGTDFNFALADNQFFNPSNPAPGWLKGVGPDPLHPCTQNPGNVPPLFQSNQISSFSKTGDPVGSGKGTSGGTGSCWLLTYNTPNEAPSASIVAPANGGTYQQGQVTQANYTCTTVNNTPNATGPYLTQASCSAIDSPGGSVAQGSQFDTATLGPHSFTATVMDSATNTASQTVQYTVVGPTDLAILNLAPRSVPTGSKMTYLIGVGDFGTANGVNVTVNDTLAPGTAFLSASGENVACSFVNRKLSCTKTVVPCAFASGTVSCNVGTIMPLSFYSLNGAVIQVTVRVTAPGGTPRNPVVISNTATVSASNADPKPSNNSSTANTTVTAH